LLAVLVLLGSPRIGSAARTWSVISLPLQPARELRPTGLAVDRVGDLYVADLDPLRCPDGGGMCQSGSIQRRDVQGSWSAIATVGIDAGQVNYPSAVTVDQAGNLYVSEAAYGIGRIQKRDAHGTWTVVAAYGSAVGQVINPFSLAADAAGSLYVAEADTRRIQKRDVQGHWSVIASGVTGPLAVDAAGDLYVGGQSIQERDAQGHWSTLAVRGASALALDSAGNLYVAEQVESQPDGTFLIVNRVERRDSQGNWTVIATAGTGLGQVMTPSGLAVDAAGSLYVAESDNHRLQKRDPEGRWSAIASGDGAPGVVAHPTSVAVDTAGSVYVQDEAEIQERDAQGNWTLLGADHPGRLAVDAAGILYVAEANQIERRDALGNWSVIAIEGGILASSPLDIAADGAGNLYVAESDPYRPDRGRIQRRDAQGNWSVLAPYGSGLGQVLFTVFVSLGPGLTGPAIPAGALAADPVGNLYVADMAQGGRIQKRDPQGNWSVVAGAGRREDQALGEDWFPAALAVDAAGTLYFASAPVSGRRQPAQVYERDARGSWSVLAPSGSDLGQVSDPSGLAMDPAGDLYVADTGNDRVQEYTPGGGS